MESNINKKRFYIIFIGFFMIFTILVFRIVNYIYFGSKDLSTMAENQYRYKEKIKELNYSLFDYKGRDLLNYKDNYYAVIDPFTYSMNNKYTKKDDLEALKIILKEANNEYDIDQKIIQNKNEKIKMPIDESTFYKLSNIKGVNGFYTYKYSEINRENSWWSIENVITNLYKNEEGKLKKKAEESLEIKIYEKTHENEPTYNVFTKDVNGNIVDQFAEQPSNNVNVRLTLDKNLQTTIKRILNKESHKDKNQIGVVLVEADTGKIKALVQKNDSMPNVNIGASTQNGFFAGSIFKVIVEEAGIESEKLSLTKIYKHKNYNGLFEEHEDKKDKNAKEAFIKSSNNVFVQIGEEVGINSIDKVAANHGFYEKILGFDQEQKGNLELDLKDIEENKGDKLQAYIGQKTRLTPVEAVNIPNVVVNKGTYIQPYIVDAFVDDNNKVIEKVNTKRSRVLSENTANIIKSHMIQVVSNEKGTGKQTFIDGVEIGGKTGTSKRVELNIGDNGTEKTVIEYYDGWFVGFFKVNNKYYSMVVFVQNIGKDINASGTAVPIFKEIVEGIYDNLNNF